MSLLRRIKGPDNPVQILKSLLQKAHADGLLIEQIKQIVNENELELTEEERERIATQPINYLLTKPERPSSTLRRRFQKAEQPSPPGYILELKARISSKLLGDEGLAQMDSGDKEAIKHRIEEILDSTIDELNLRLAHSERQQLFDAIVADVSGAGPLDYLLKDEFVTEIYIHSPNNIWTVHKAQLKQLNLKFESEEHIQRILNRILEKGGQQLSEKTPIVHTRIPSDGGGFIHISAAIPPISANGTSATLLKHSGISFEMSDMVRLNTLDAATSDFIRACVIARLNVLISGCGGCGRTSMLNVAASFIPENERILVIERRMELDLKQSQLTRLVARPGNQKDEVTVSDLLAQAYYMNPERIIVGELFGDEAMDVMRQMAGGQNVMTTIRGHDIREALKNIETKCLFSVSQLPLRAIREQIASGLDVIIHMERLHDGSRKVVRIAEVVGMEGDMIALMDIFQFVQEDEEGGRGIGKLQPTGYRPKFLDRMEAMGIRFPVPYTGLPRR